MYYRAECTENGASTIGRSAGVLPAVCQVHLQSTSGPSALFVLERPLAVDRITDLQALLDLDQLRAALNHQIHLRR